jgi:hypothetical protein
MNGSAAAASPALLDKKAAKLKYKEERKRIKEKEKEMKEQKKKEAKEAKKRGKGFVGASISGPTNFSHDTHVGWDMDHGFEVRHTTRSTLFLLVLHVSILFHLGGSAI